MKHETSKSIQCVFPYTVVYDASWNDMLVPDHKCFGMAQN